MTPVPRRADPGDVEYSAMAGLQHKAALVTGGSRGIGRAIAERLADDGAAVVFSYLSNADAAADVVAGIRAAGGTVHAVQADPRRPWRGSSPLRSGRESARPAGHPGQQRRCRGGRPPRP